MSDDWNSPAMVRARRITGRNLATFLAFVCGAPWLNDWEANFLESMADIHRRTGGMVELSEKQAKVILRIEDKFGGLTAMHGRAPEDKDQAAD